MNRLSPSEWVVCVCLILLRSLSSSFVHLSINYFSLSQYGVLLFSFFFFVISNSPFEIDSNSNNFALFAIYLLHIFSWVIMMDFYAPFRMDSTTIPCCLVAIAGAAIIVDAAAGAYRNDFIQFIFCAFETNESKKKITKRASNLEITPHRAT